MLSHILSVVMPRFKRGIQYFRGFSIQAFDASGILDRPIKSDDDIEFAV
jgi:GTP1/Obg family GTP-binding protein